MRKKEIVKEVADMCDVTHKTVGAVYDAIFQVLLRSPDPTRTPIGTFHWVKRKGRKIDSDVVRGGKAIVRPAHILKFKPGALAKQISD